MGETSKDRLKRNQMRDRKTTLKNNDQIVRWGEMVKRNKEARMTPKLLALATRSKNAFKII